MSKKIYVTNPFLPPLEEFLPSLEKIWESRVLTNGGPFHQELEAKLCDYLGAEHISLFANGTIALVTALQALRISGEVITTPYSFVATSHSLIWNGIKPVFVDIDPETFNLDPKLIESAITPTTTAIMPVHCYGVPCDVKAIKKIAETYNLKVIYDAAHAFGVKHEGESLLNYGDLSVLSFHATKVFNTFEGGAIVCPDAATKKRIDNLKNFGFIDEITVVAPGINGKMSEINAALGLLQLKYADTAIQKRSDIATLYRQALSNVNGVIVPSPSKASRHNHSYYPILIDEAFGMSRDELYDLLKKHDIFARRYFYPLISEFPMYRSLSSAKRANLPLAHKISNQILCLPIYPDLSQEDQIRIISIITNRE
jgi:dTDP-4-amino-4,6-dideoxygalactose transaminase